MTNADWRPPGETGGRKTLFLTLGAVAVLVVGGLAIVGMTTGGSGDEDGTIEVGEVQEPSDDPDAFVDEEGGYELTVPDGWAFTAIHGDGSDSGEQLFPDDPEKAAAIQDAMAVLPRTIIGYGVVADQYNEAAYATNANVAASPVPDEDIPSYDEFVGFLSEGLEMTDIEVTDDEPFSMLDGEGTRVEFEADAFGAAGYLYAAVVDGQLWQFTTFSADLDEDEDTFDAMAQSMRVID